MTKTATYWRCTIRNENVQCNAPVSQTGDVFKEGAIGHSHPGDPGPLKKVKVRAQVNTISKYLRSEMIIYQYVNFELCLTSSKQVKT